MILRMVLLLALGLASLSDAHAAAFQLTETANIGATAEDPDYLFGMISFVVLGPDETVIVADYQIARLRQYSADGIYLQDIGREGGGPGEFYEIRGLETLPNGNIAILSNPSQLSLFDGHTGDYLGAVQAPTSLHTQQMMAHDDDGYIYVKDSRKPTNPLDEWQLLWRKLDSSGETLGEIEIPLQEVDGELMYVIFPEGGSFNFLASTESAWSPKGYLVVGRSDQYRIEIRRPGGTITIDREFEPVHVLDGERKAWESIAADFTARSGKEFQIPKKKPAFHDLQVDSYGRIWVRRYAQAVQHMVSGADGEEYAVWREPNHFDVFDEDASHLGSVILPIGVRAVAFAEAAIWGVRETDEGQELVRWTLGGLSQGTGRP